MMILPDIFWNKVPTCYSYHAEWHNICPMTNLRFWWLWKSFIYGLLGWSLTQGQWSPHYEQLL